MKRLSSEIITICKILGNFLIIYNPLQNLWGISSSSGFWGWWPFLLAPLLIGTCILYGVLGGVHSYSMKNYKRVVRELLPMALLMSSCALYYLGRSVDFTLAIAFAPMFAIYISTWLETMKEWNSATLIRKAIVLCFGISLSLCITYGLVSFYHPGAKYNTPSQICIRDGDCKISSLVEIMSALVGKSGAGMNFKRSFVESFGESNKAIVASITSIEL